MSGRDSDVEWVETTEEAIETEESLSLKKSTPAGPVVVVSDLEPSDSSILKLLNTVGQEQTPDGYNGFCCEECLTLFQEQSDPDDINSPSFILDFPTSLGVPQRALLTLPFGLMIGRSSIPSAGVGVINHGPVVSPGMHFGPYEGELTTRENALASDFSWEIYQEEDQYEYIDAAKDSSSNWMRYVNFARNDEEANLLAVQCKGSVLFHCCRSIDCGDELTVWPSSKMYSQFSKVWAQLLILKQNKSESAPCPSNPIYLCSICQLTFTTEDFLLRHTKYVHAPPRLSEAADEGRALDVDSDERPASVEPVGSAKSKACGDCGKVFKRSPHLRRHKLVVHSNERPYCCSHCRKSFSQASGLIRHQLVHRKQAAVANAANQKKILSEAERAEDLDSAEAAESEETKEVNAGENPPDVVAANTSAEAEVFQLICSLCGKGFTKEASLKKHKATAHANLRPYVCSMCQKCFRQSYDLKRHLKNHRETDERREEVNVDSELTLPFSCAECCASFTSVDALQEHINELHSDAAEAEPRDGVADSVQVLPSDRPRRPKAASNVSALTKLVAPKHKAAAPAQRSASELDAELVRFKWFSCNRCKQTYGSPEDLKGHKCTAATFGCEQCGATFQRSDLLQRHVQVKHLTLKLYSCDRCEKSFNTARSVTLHQKSDCMKYRCTSELFACSFCQFSFTTKSYLMKHIRRHHTAKYLSPRDCDSQTVRLDSQTVRLAEDEGEHVCLRCGAAYKTLKGLKCHKCADTLKVLYLCTDCGKSFTQKHRLSQHQRVHTGEKPYTCPDCGKSFSFNGQLNVHLRTHTGEKPYLCPHCGESFRQSGDLKRHERKHTGVRPHGCPECGKCFSRPQSLKAHQMLHLGQRMFKCTQCGKSFSRNYHLRRHHQKVHT